jgi:hypothetical protein
VIKREQFGFEGLVLQEDEREKESCDVVSEGPVCSRSSALLHSPHLHKQQVTSSFSGTVVACTSCIIVDGR